MGKISFKKMTKEEYKQLKNLINIGVSAPHLRKSGITKRSESSLYLIKKSTSFDDYKAIVKSYKYKKQEPVKAPVGDIDDKRIDEIIPLLKQLIKNVDRLATVWEEQPKKILL